MFYLVRQVEEGLAPHALALSGAAAVAKAAAVRPGHADMILHVMGTITAVIALGFVLGRIFRRFGQPQVIGEVVAGILLGPSVLGAISPDAMHALIPSLLMDSNGQVPSALKAIAQLGVVLYMFLVGLELNAAQLKGRAHAAVVTVLLAPAFFAFTGMRTQIGLVSSGTDWVIVAVICLVATLGKFGGTFMAARLAGHSGHDAAVLGTLMNEHARVDGADCVEHWPRPSCLVPHAVCHDGADGVAYHHGHRSGARVAPATTRWRSLPHHHVLIYHVHRVRVVMGRAALALSVQRGACRFA